MTRPSRFSPEVRTRAVRMVLEHEAAHDSQWAAITSIAEKIGCTAETLRKWVRQAERDQGTRPGLTTEERQRLKQLERENVELRRANEILKKAAAFFAQAELDRRANDGAVHRHAPRYLWGRADLRGAADRPVPVLRVARPAARSRALAAPHASERRAARPNPSRVARGARSLRRPEGVEAAATGRGAGGPLHGGTADAPARLARCDPWPQGQENHVPHQRRAAAARVAKRSRSKSSHSRV